MLAVIGGSGLSQLANLEIRQRRVARTPYGEPSGPLTFGALGGREIVFLARHGHGHTIPPHQVNYRANIWALKDAGVRNVVSVASVGGIRANLGPGVLLVHYRGGLQGETLKDAEMIAGLGYVVFAEDIFGVNTPPKTVPEMTALTDVYNKNRPLMRTRSRAGFDVLAKNAMVDPAKVGVVGYCFGGTVAVELGETGIPALGVVAVHGSFRDFAP